MLSDQPGTRSEERRPASAVTRYGFRAALVIQGATLFVLAFGDIGFDKPGRFGLDYGHFLLLALLGVGAAVLGACLAWRLRHLGAWMLQLVMFFLAALWLLAGWTVVKVVTAPRPVTLVAMETVAGAVLEEVTTTTADGVEVHGWLAGSSEHEVVLLFAGRGGNRLSLLGLAEYYIARGWSVLLPDLRATGTSGGDRIGLGYLERLDVRAWIELVRSRGFTDLGLHGQSLGAAAITYTLAETGDEPAAFLVLDSCYDDLRTALSNRLPWVPLPGLSFKPVEWFGAAALGAGAEDLRPLACVPVITSPVLFLAGDSDSKVRPAETRRLFEACGSPDKLLRWIRGGRHTNLWSHDARAYAAALDELLDL